MTKKVIEAIKPHSINGNHLRNPEIETILTFMARPFFTIILPCFNSEIFIDDAISSVRSQSFEDFELIIIDDGSTDCSWDVITKAAQLDPRIHQIQIERSGVSEARNRGLTIAKGSFITFIDADDIMEEDALANYYSIVSKQEVDLVIGSAFQFSECIANRSYRREIDGLNFYQGAELSSISRKLFRGSFDHANWNKLYRRERVNSKETRFDKRLVTGEDMMFNWDYWNDIETVCLTSTPVMNYRRHPKSVSRNTLSQFEKFRMLIIVFEERERIFSKQSVQICSDYLNEIFWYYELPDYLKASKDGFLEKTRKVLSISRTTTIQRGEFIGNIKIKILQIILKISSKLFGNFVSD
jgi:glycosyltransferase involved in cell wall biosynthesis